MASVELIEAEVLRMPDIIGDSLQIRCSLVDGMLVEAVKAGFIDDIDNGFFSVGDGQ